MSAVITCSPAPTARANSPHAGPRPARPRPRSPTPARPARSNAQLVRYILLTAVPLLVVFLVDHPSTYRVEGLRRGTATRTSTRGRDNLCADRAHGLPLRAGAHRCEVLPGLSPTGVRACTAAADLEGESCPARGRRDLRAHGRRRAVPRGRPTWPDDLRGDSYYRA